MKEILGFIAIAMAFFAYAPYLRDILARRTIPHPYSWFVWSFSSSLIFGLQLTHGGGPGAYVTGCMAAICFVIGILAYRNGAGRSITRGDTVLFVVALVAAALWLFVDQPMVSILLLVSADVIAIIPSARKAWHKPYEETLSMWGINALRHSVAIGALAHYNIVTILDPLTWVVANTAFAALLVVRRHFVESPRRRNIRGRTRRHK